MHTLKHSRRQTLSDNSDSWGSDRPDHPAFSHAVWATIGVTAAAAIAGGISSADASRKAQHASQDALKAQKDIAGSLKYEPINLDKLKADASAQAVANATQSLALERSLQPDVAAARSGYAKSVNDQLSLGGKLSPDVANQVAQAGRTAGSLSGIGGNSAPVTAALIGQTAQGLLQQRQDNAANLVNANPLPVAGLDPGSLASAEVAQNAAQNQFNLEKSGISSNLANSTANIQASTAGANASLWNNAIGAAANIAGKYASSRTGGTSITPTTTGGVVPAYQAPSNPMSFNSTIPQVSASGLWGACWVAREVYGEENPKWLQFRSWMLDQSPRWFRKLYLAHGEAFALWVHNFPRIKKLIRLWMDARIRG